MWNVISELKVESFFVYFHVKYNYMVLYPAVGFIFWENELFFSVLCTRK
jgi:hypothetical protein